MDEHLKLPVHPALRPYVASLHGYRLSGYRPGTHVGVPSAEITCVIDLSEPLRLTTAGGTQVAHDASISGIHLSPVTIQHDGHQHGIMLMLTPAGARGLTGLPAGELADHVICLADVLGPSADSLLDQLRAARGWTSLAILQNALLRRLPESPPDTAGLRMWHLLRNNQTRLIEDTARISGWSERHLRATVRSELGHSAGALLRLLRFQRSLSIARPGELARAAALSGYADQAHLTREWRRYLGMTPSDYLSLEEFIPV